MYSCGKKSSSSSYNIALASALAIKEYREGNYGGEIGIIVNLTPSYARSNSEEDLKAAKVADLFFNRLFFRSCY